MPARRSVSSPSRPGASDRVARSDSGTCADAHPDSLRDLLPEQCDWCPRRCKANRRAGARGVCGADDTLRVARAALHFWEEPPLSGESGSGAVFFSGCPLHCIYCQNAEISDGESGKAIDLPRLSAIFLELQAQGALNINAVTPTHYAPLIIHALQDARASGLRLPLVWNTSGYETAEAVRALRGKVDVYLTDFKYAHDAFAARYSNAPDYPRVALQALDEMVRQDDAQVIVRHLLLPGCAEDSQRVVDLLHRRFGSAITFSFMSQYTPMLHGIRLDRFPELKRSVSADEYEALLDYADSIGIEDYFWQDGNAAKESFIPAFDHTGV